MLFKEDKEQNNNFSKKNNIFTISINSYKEIYIERNCNIYYNIQITDNNLKNSWNVEKTIDDFQNLYEKIFILHPYIPMLPKKTLFKITSLHTIDKRKFELQHFLNFCINRKDILLNKDFINFLQISQKCPNLVLNSIKKEEELSFELSVANFIYIKNKEILILLCVNNDFISSDEINLNNILSIRNNYSGEKTPLSHVFIYQLIKEKEKNIINKIWEKSIFVLADIIYFEENKEILCVGCDDGKIYLYNPKTKGDYKKMEFYGELSFHSKKITGLYINPINMELYSISLDCMFFCADLKDKLFSKSLIYNNTCGYTGLKYNKEENIFITSDEEGYISIFCFSYSHYKIFLYSQTKALNKINTLFIFNKYLFTGCKNGIISVIDLSFINFSLLKEINTINLDESEINCITYNQINNEIIIGDEKGNIIIWNNKINNYIYCLKGHSPYAVRHLWIDENNILWSSGDDKKIKKWIFPNKWFNEDIYLFSTNLKEKKNKKNLLDFDDSENNISSDEDELNGWSKNL